MNIHYPTRDFPVRAVIQAIAAGQVVRIFDVPFSTDPDEIDDRHPALDLLTSLGTLCDRDGGRRLWPVHPRTHLPNDTFSVNNLPGTPHTDATWHLHPPIAVGLLCARPAKLGGITQLFPHAQLESIAERTLGDHWHRLLAAAPVQWLRPRAFGDSSEQSARAPVWSPHTGWRVRLDTMMQGMNLTAPVNDFAAALASEDPWYSTQLSAGELILFSNQRFAHGRTAFSDPARLLWRIRFRTLGP